MRHRNVIILLVVLLAVASLSATAATDNCRTFSAVGDSVAYSSDSLYHARLTRDANMDLMQFKVENHNNPVKYNVTLSESQYNQLKAAKEKGEIKELIIRTNQPIEVKVPVIENCTKKVCSQDYYDEASFERDFNSLDEKILDSNIDVNVTGHVNPSNGIEYKRISIYKTYYVAKSFRNTTEYIAAHVVVNNMQADGKDWVYFHAPSLGIDGTMAADHIEI